MLSNIIHNEISKAQNQMHRDFNDFSEQHEIIGRLLALPVAFVDVTLETFKVPLAVIEYLALAAINLIGAIFDPDKYTIKHALLAFEVSLLSVLKIPLALALLPIKLLFQTGAIFIHPELANSINDLTTFSFRPQGFFS